MKNKNKRSTTPMDKVVIVLAIITVILIVVLIKMYRYYNKLLKEYDELQNVRIVTENDLYDGSGMYERLLENTVSEEIVENKI